MGRISRYVVCMVLVFTVTVACVWTNQILDSWSHEFCIGRKEEM
jgi:hypothetical protein